MSVLTQLKRLELADDPTNEGDEYLDAFVALGGSSDKGGYVEKNILIEIIKTEFELTIDMVVSIIAPRPSKFCNLPSVCDLGVPAQDRRRQRGH